MDLSGLKIFCNFMKISQKSCIEGKNEGYFLEVDAYYPENLHEPHNDLTFSPEIKNL